MTNLPAAAPAPLPGFVPRDRTLLMGVLNVTPDSFSDGGRWADPEAAVAHAHELIAQGADIIDVGGESTRPGAQRVDVDTEISRVLPVVRALLADTSEGGGSAIISVDTDRTIRIEGVAKLNGYRHTALPDRIEAASWAAAALATHGDIYVRGAHQPDMTTFLNTFRKVGGAFDIDADGIRFYHPGEPLHSIALETAVHPGFMTDWQQPLVVALTQAEGLSIVHETVYENRFGFTEALRKMGANIQVYRECLGGTPCRFGQKNYYHSAVISGPTPLHSADIEVPDLRGGFSHLIAALAASGTSTVSGIDVISRGYEHFTRKLHQLDARVRYLDA